jgi:hypothetical protein
MPENDGLIEQKRTTEGDKGFIELFLPDRQHARGATGASDLARLICMQEGSRVLDSLHLGREFYRCVEVVNGFRSCCLRFGDFNLFHV